MTAKPIGYIQQPTRRVRKHTCPSCGLVVSRKLYGVITVCIPHSFPNSASLIKPPDAFIPSSPILTPIHASRETLTHIRIPVPADIATYESLTQFFSFRFPCLSTLYLGGWSTTLAVPVGAAFTTFLVAHPLIEDLHLGFWECWNELHCRISPDIVLGPSTLPNLRRLTVDAFNLGVFVRSGMSSLKLLETLHIGSGYLRREDEGVGFAEMYRALEAYGGLPQLKALRLTLEGLNDEGEDAHWIAGLGRLCPKVERLWGNYNVWWTAVSHIICPIMPLLGVCSADVPIMSFRSGTEMSSRPTITSDHK